MLRALLLAAALLTVPAFDAAARSGLHAPYPSSSLIAGITWHANTYASGGPGGDIWASTSGADGSVYAAWGDGTIGCRRKVSYGVAALPAVPRADPHTVGCGPPGVGHGKIISLLDVHGTLLGQRKPKGRCETGWVYEQRLRLRGERGQVMEVRRITVALDQPTRDGDTEIHILTNLPTKKAPAVRVAEVYRERWTIEGLFFEASAVLSCEIDTLCYPRAALFAFCLGLLACNAVALLKAALRAEHGEDVVSERLSAYYLVLEIRQTYAGMMVAIPPGYWSVFEGFDDTQMAQVLGGIARRVSIDRYRKTPRGPKKPPPPRKRYKSGEHVATSQVIAGRKKR